jgi:hypothetical protein
MKSIISSFFFFIFLSGFLHCQTFGGGDGSLGNPYHISSGSHLMELATQVNSGNEYVGKFFLQTTDISLSSYADWTPIGGGTDNKLFRGNFNGATYKITNLTINKPNSTNIGLFGHLGRGAVLKNVKLEEVNVVGGRGTGSLVGRVTGDETNLIENCYAKGSTNRSVVGDGATGGLIGSHNSYVVNPSNRDEHPVAQFCFADINVTWSRKSGSGADKFGGFTGCNQRGKIYFSYATGNVTVNNNPAVTVSNSDGSIPSRIGGFSGCIELRGYIENCFSVGQVTTYGTVQNVGGFLGKGGIGGSHGDGYDCYYDMLTTNPSTSATPYLPSGIVAKSTDQMKSQSTYVSWDFVNIWSIIEGYYPTLRNVTPSPINITFENGMQFVPEVTPGNINQAIGRFKLIAESSGAHLKRTTIILNGERTGLSNFKLWKSTDNTFNSAADTQYGLTIENDPGVGGKVSFSQEDFDIGLAGDYFFLTSDVAADASGSIGAYLEDTSSLTFFDGVITSGTLTSAPLSNTDAPLPVTLSDFSVAIDNSVPVIHWVTQTETENLGWNIFRSEVGDLDMVQINSELIAGMGTTTQQTEYFFIDESPLESGLTYSYWLQSISFGGDLELFGPVSVYFSEGNIPDAPDSSFLKSNYPNPFNPNTNIEFGIRPGDHGVLSIYNIQGKIILSKTFDAGYHAFNWDANNMASGVYFYSLRTERYFKVFKMTILK